MLLQRVLRILHSLHYSVGGEVWLPGRVGSWVMGSVSLVTSPSPSQVSPGVSWSEPGALTSPCTPLSNQCGWMSHAIPQRKWKMREDRAFIFLL